MKELAKLLPRTAYRVRGDEIQEVDISDLQEGDVVLLRPGAGAPADGVVRSGHSSVNEAMITGESRPVEKTEGSAVIAGTVNGSGSLHVEVTGTTGERTALAGIMRLVEQAQSSRSRAQALADRAAFLLTITALVAGALTFIVWTLLNAEPAFAVERLVTTLVISCPHALGLAVPLVIAISTTLGARNGLLVRDRRGLEEARLLDTVVFDKTGTLTRGEFGVVEIVAVQDVPAAEALRLAAGVERDSEHTIAHGIVRTAEERGISIPAAQDFAAIPGHGVQARIGEQELFMGGPALLHRLELQLPPELQAAADLRPPCRGSTTASPGRGPSALHPLSRRSALRACRPEPS